MIDLRSLVGRTRYALAAWLTKGSPSHPPRPEDEATEAETLRVLALRAQITGGGGSGGAVPGHVFGAGMEAAGVRAYRLGDEYRDVDWNVTARRGSLHVKEYATERDLPTLIVMDRSRSLFGASHRGGSRDAKAAAAILMLSQLGADHPVGLVDIEGSDLRVVLPDRGDLHGRRLLACLFRPRAAATQRGLRDALRAAYQLLGPRSLAVPVSDFRGDPAEWASDLGRIAKGHAVVPVWVRAPSVADLPPVGVIDVEDPATGLAKAIDTSDHRTREALRRREEHWTEGVFDVFARLSVRPLVVSPGSDLASVIGSYFAVPQRGVT